MGLLGTLLGWDQQKDAHNAVLASYLADNASPELRAEILKRLILIQQQINPAAGADPDSIVADLSHRSRIVQTNFIALACNNLGIPPGLGNLQFQPVENPYRADNESSLNRIGVAVDDLSRRCGRQLKWPGNHVRVNFLAWKNVTKSDSVEDTGTNVAPSRAADLACQYLLADRIPVQLLKQVATQLSMEIEAKTDHELALATALLFFEMPDLIDDLRAEQMTARMTMVEWLQSGLIGPAEAKHFENQLYTLYKP